MRKVSIAARKNPTQNKKISAVDYLRQWKNDPNAYISFTEINKIGINPKSKYNTPLGIYTYPLATVWVEYDLDYASSLNKLPFAANLPHIWIITPKSNSNIFIDDLYSDYTSKNYDKDSELLKDLFIEESLKNMEVDLSYTNTHDVAFIERWKKEYKQKVYDKWANIYAKNIITTKVKNPGGFFWNLCRLISMNLAVPSEDSTTPILSINSFTDVERRIASIKWNWLLRKCGYSGFADKHGQGIIHESEPIQAVFLSTSSFKVIGNCNNISPVYKDKRKYIKTASDLFPILSNAKYHPSNLNQDEDRAFDKLLLGYLIGFYNESVLKELPFKVVVDKNVLWNSFNKIQYEVLLDYCKEHSYENLKEKKWWRNTAVTYLELIKEKHDWR
jgi:hypothetical protein